jgi:uncharacterized membrane protein YdfJ with MMPL/SSD domain
MNKWIYLTTKQAVWILAAGIILAAVAATWGLGVFKHLSSGGFDDAQSSSAKSATIIAREFPTKQTDLIVLFTSPSLPIADSRVLPLLRAQVDKISSTSGVSHVTSVVGLLLPSLVSRNGRQTYALVTLAGGASAKQATYDRLSSLVPGSSDLQVQYGGEVAINEQINHQTTSDLAKAELLSFPILGMLLLIIFRSVIAALVPLVLGGLSILVAFLIIRIITLFADVSIYAINIITLLGLGLAIDYSLFTVSRFREELALGHNVSDALAQTMRTAGRTVLFSGLTVILAMLGLLVFHQSFLRSMGLGGAAAVAATVIISSTVLPAALGLLGRRINALPLPGIGRTLSRSRNDGIWYRYSRVVMRRPVVMFSAALILLVALGSPFLGVHFSTPDATTVPPSLSSRQVNDAMTNNFTGASQSPIVIAAHAPSSAAEPGQQRLLAQYMSQLSDVSGAVQVVVAGLSGQYIQINILQKYPPQSSNARKVVRAIRTIEVPASWQVESGGQSASLEDLLSSLGARIPWAGLIIVITTSTLLFLMLGSIVIPAKAIILNVLSLSAAFGLLVWVFQDGHGASALGLSSTGSIDATQPVLIFAIAFGLAMDYELFLLSRIKEEYDRSGDTTQAIAVGIQRTAGIITSAALMLVVVIGLFATGKISIIQQVGVGLGAAVAIDATIVRMVLVPSTMQLLGQYNWWAPKTLSRLVRRLGLRDA